MTTRSEPAAKPPSRAVVYYDEPPKKPPPLLVVGPLAWVRHNLFRSWVDTLLTLVTGTVIVSVLASFLSWAIGQANWFVVVFNLRLLMVGRFAQDANWRLNILLAIGAFTIGMMLALWMRVSRGLLLIVVTLLVVLFAAPPLIASLIPPSPSYMAAGTLEIVYGASNVTPQPQVGFIARAGETISVQMADRFSKDDQALTTMLGFADKAAALLANAASNRLDNAARIAALNAQLASDLLTNGQRVRLKAQLSKYEVAPPISETFGVNKGQIVVRLLRGSTLETLASATLGAGSAPLKLTLPADGWYVLEKLPADNADKGAAILEIAGIGPMLARDLTGSSEGSGLTRTTEYIRVTDSFSTQEKRPAPNDKDVPMALLTDNGYRGNRTAGDFLRLYVGPFFDLLKIPFLFVAVVMALGYFATDALDRLIPPSQTRRRASRRIVTYLLIAFPVVMFLLVYGVGDIFPLTEPRLWGGVLMLVSLTAISTLGFLPLGRALARRRSIGVVVALTVITFAIWYAIGTALPLTDTRRWGGLLLTVVLTLISTIASFPLGVLLALGRRSELPVVRVASTIYIEFVRGVPLITVLFMAQLLLPLVNPALAELPNAFRAMIAIMLFNAAYLAENVRGGLQAIPHGQIEAAKALGLGSLQITLEITLPQALRAIFPALVGMVISLFKDTSLVAIVGLLDLTGMAENTVTQTEFIGQRRETLLFITLIYFGISYLIAGVSRRIERSGSGAVRAQRI